ncbi:MAG: PEP-CTERM sorting domain-containing protein [Terriglobia bacterium]|jgi:hypothetical protein
MRILRGLILCSIVVALPLPALPDSLPIDAFDPSSGALKLRQPSVPVDPQVLVRRNGRGVPGAAVPFEGSDFTFLVPTGTGIFAFFNENDQAFRSLTFTIFPGGPGPSGDLLFTCKATSDLKALPFSNCHFSQFGSLDTPTVVRFQGGEGLPSMSFFTVYLTGFAPHTEVSVESTFLPIPEPGTLLLCFPGLAALIAWRRR